MANKLWTREELMLAFELYLEIPFGKIHWSNLKVIELSKLLNRTPASISIRLSNFAHVDPYHQGRGVKGMSGGKKQVEPIWNEFNANRDNLLFECAIIRAKYANKSIEEYYHISENDLYKEGKTREQIIQARVNQTIFRKIVLAAYDNSCCITGINDPDLLIASHIIPWSKDKKNRLNPQNGFCFNPLHDKAFEIGLITITPDYKIKNSSEFKKQSKDAAIQEYFLRFENKQITLPSRFLPDKDFLKYHNEERFKG